MDFYEEDEPVAELIKAFEEGEQGVTGKEDLGAAFAAWSDESLALTQMTFGDVVESEPMKGALGGPKWVAIQRTSDGLEVKLPKGVVLSRPFIRESEDGGWLVTLYVPDENGRSRQDS